VDYSYNRIRGINVSDHHDDYDHSAGCRKDDHHLHARKNHQEGGGGKSEVSQRLQESLDNFVRQGIGDQEGDGGESEVSSRLQGKEERSKISGDHHDYDSPIPRVGPGLVRGLWSGGAN
jgi:hypothetical protein